MEISQNFVAFSEYMNFTSNYQQISKFCMFFPFDCLGDFMYLYVMLQKLNQQLLLRTNLLFSSFWLADVIIIIENLINTFYALSSAHFYQEID